jgi:hypothetical protein
MFSQIWINSPASLTHLTMCVFLQFTHVQAQIVASVLEKISHSYSNLCSLILRIQVPQFRLQFKPEHWYTILKNAHWPKLESLEFSCKEPNFNKHPCSYSIEPFFLRHALIRSLSPPTMVPSSVLQGETTSHDLLSNLKSLETQNTLSEMFDISALSHSNWQLGSYTPQGLVFLSCSISPRCFAILKVLPNLRCFIARIKKNANVNCTLRTTLEVLGRMPRLERLEGNAT